MPTPKPMTSRRVTMRISLERDEKKRCSPQPGRRAEPREGPGNGVHSACPGYCHRPLTGLGSPDTLLKHALLGKVTRARCLLFGHSHALFVRVCLFCWPPLHVASVNVNAHGACGIRSGQKRNCRSLTQYSNSYTLYSEKN